MAIIRLRMRRESRAGRNAYARKYSIIGTMRYLGIDYGSKRVGLALSDEAGTMGFPHKILTNTPDLLDTMAGLVENERVGGIVMGESRDLAGGENPIAKDARAFGVALGLRTGLPIYFESEIYTSAEARRAPEKQEKTR